MKTQFLFIAFFICVLTVMFYIWISTPVVEYSWSTKECVNVLYSENFSCESLPQRYTTAWVK